MTAQTQTAAKITFVALLVLTALAYVYFKFLKPKAAQKAETIRQAETEIILAAQTEPTAVTEPRIIPQMEGATIQTTVTNNAEPVIPINDQIAKISNTEVKPGETIMINDIPVIIQPKAPEPVSTTSTGAR